MNEQRAQTAVSTHHSYSMLSQAVAEAVREQLSVKKTSALGLSTGRTPTGCYRILADWSQSGLVDWSGVRCFGLDEYYDVDEGSSFGSYLRQHLYRYTNLQAAACFNPLYVDDYEQAIGLSGGLDLTLLGIGTNGHIAFNEPGTILESWTHSILLTESTRQANAEFFGSGHIPRAAVTMGISTILGSRRIILIVSGQHKKEILQRALLGPVTVDVPASFLQLHEQLTVMADFEF